MEGPLVRLMEMTRREFVPPSTFRIGTPDDFIGPEENADSYGVIMVDER